MDFEKVKYERGLGRDRILAYLNITWTISIRALELPDVAAIPALPTIATSF
jgi:hypothetical protein